MARLSRVEMNFDKISGFTSHGKTLHSSKRVSNPPLVGLSHALIVQISSF